jgi:hypothetical protein
LYFSRFNQNITLEDHLLESQPLIRKFKKDAQNNNNQKTLQKQRKNSQNKKMEEFSDARLSYKF